MSNAFDWSKYENPSFDWSKYENETPKKSQEPATLKGSAIAYGSGLAGGAGGAVPDALKLLQTVAPFSQAAHATKQLADVAGLKGTHELTSQIAGQEPQNALERILQSSGQFGGQEGLIGTALGGPTAGALGTAHGSASGALYGGLKELGLDDEWALGLTTLFSLSPIAGQKLITKIKADKEFKNALKTVEKDVGISPSEPPSPPSPPSPSQRFSPGETLPESRGAFAQKEEVVNKLNRPIEGSPLNIQPQFASTTKEVPTLQGRISEAPELGEVISRQPFETEAQAGRSIAKEVREVRDAEREVVREKYKKAEEITASHNDIFPELAQKNEERIRRLENIEKRSTGEEAVYQDALALRKMIGTPEGLIETNSDRLMKQANSFSQKVKYELPYAGYKGEIKSIVHEMNDAVIHSLKKNKLNADAVIDADKTFSRFADRFMGDEISPYFSKKILNPEQIGKNVLTDEGTYRAVKNAIGSRKSEIINKIDRELVHKTMDKYYKNPDKVNSKEYVKDLKNLSEKIGKEKTSELDHFLRQKQLDNERKLFLQNKIRETQLAREKLPSKGPPKAIQLKKSLAETPEQIDKLFNNRSDIRRLKKQMKDQGLEKEFKELSEKKLEEILKEGGFGAKKITGTDLKRIIDKEHEVLSELLGEEELSALYKVASIAGKKELTEEMIKQVAKSVVKMGATSMGIGKIIKLIPFK